MAQNGENSGSEASKVVISVVKPWIVVEASKANEAVEFYKAAFGAEEVKRVNNPKRKADQEQPLVVFTELKLGSCTFLVSDLYDDSSAPVKSAVTSVFWLECEDVEAARNKAVAVGGISEGEISEGEGACCGGRVAKVKDPYGNIWMICSSSSTSSSVVDVEAQ